VAKRERGKCLPGLRRRGHLGGAADPVCERQINDWGLRAFLREAQHDVAQASGYFFEVSGFAIVDDAPNLTSGVSGLGSCRDGGAGDYTAAVLLGIAESGVIYVLQVTRGQFASDKVRQLIQKNAQRVHDRFPRYSIHLPQIPDRRGKDQADQLRKLLSGFRSVRVESATGSKAVRARDGLRR